MSLVVLSSSQSDYDTENARNRNNAYASNRTAQGLQHPYNFRNHINPPMKIPANSEVAVQSIKLFRKSIFSIPSDTTYSWYLGEPINDDRWQSGDDASMGSRYQGRSLSGIDSDNIYIGTTSLPFPVFIRKGNYTPEQMAVELERGFKTAICHPDYFFMNNVSEQEDAGENGTGFTWSISNQGDHLTLNRVDGTALANTTCIGRVNGISISNEATGGTGTDLTWERDTSKLTRTRADDGNWVGAILTDYPISLTNGNINYDVSDVSASSRGWGWRVGLVRPCMTDGREMPSYAEGNPESFFDYAVSWAQVGGTTDAYLQLEHAVWDPVKRKLVMEEVEYWNTGLTGVASAKITTTVMGAGQRWKNIYFQCSGENILITAEQQDATIHTIANTPQNVLESPAGTIKAVKTANPKPIGQTCWAMYPAMSLLYGTEGMKITQFSGIMNGAYPPTVTTESAFPNMILNSADPNTIYYPYPQSTDLANDIHYSSGQAYYMKSFDDPEILEGCINIDSRSCYQTRDGVTQKEYIGLDETANQVCPYLWNGVIVMPTNNGWDTTAIGDYTCHTDDVSLLLGFEGSSSLLQPYAGNTYALNEDTIAVTPNIPAWWNLPSFTIPKLHSTALFVKCGDLTHQSYNMGKGIPSKILYHIPRFNMGGSNESGRFGAGEIFYEPSEKTYLDLNNPNELNFNDLEMSIVDKNERWATDLGGSTTIVLHFRQKR